MRLSETQARLWPAITGMRPQELGGIVAAGPRLSPERRIEIYSQMYFWRLVDALREDFPKLASLLGDDPFAELVRAYIQAYPSEHPSLGRLGRSMARFLSEHSAEGARPDLADLAALEWARAEVFVESDAPPAPPSVFSQLPPEEFAQARVRLVPAMRVLALQHDAIALWHAIENDEAVPDPIHQEQRALVWRKDWEVYHAPIDAEEAQALRWAQDGRTLSEICEAFSEREEPAMAAFASLQSWTAEALVAAVDPI